MLKKSKNIKLAPAPSPPTVEEMLKDIETFQVDTKAAYRVMQPSGGDVQLQNWWLQFEQFVEDVNKLKVLSTEINNCQLKLETSKVETETETQLLKNSVDEQRQKIEDLEALGSG